MDGAGRRVGSQAGRFSGFWVAATGLGYLAVLIGGFASLGNSGDSIADPTFFTLEALILLQAPGIVILFAAIAVRAEARNRVLAVAALVFASSTALLTTALHFALIILRDPRAELHDAVVRAFTWPSLPYAIDILAWDIFYPLAALSAAPTFGLGGREGTSRKLLQASGLFALAGLFGVVLGDMNVRNLGIIGYGIFFPVAALVLARLFEEEANAPR